ncbi:MFS transporter [bacterium AH-315-O15]|nr:MFS transporter [bacterium AH-315-O15]
MDRIEYRAPCLAAVSEQSVSESSLPWFRQLDAQQWRAFLATFLGWLLDGFDFTIMTFILIDIQESFTVDAALAGALGTVTLLFRLVGGLGAGMMADRYGRKLPLMLSILWFSLFAFLSGFSTSYAMLFAFRALFGIGMGGEWAAGMPLSLEPHRTLLDTGPDPQHHERRNHPGPEHDAPPERRLGRLAERIRHRSEDRVDVGKGQRREDVAPVPAPLQEPRRQPAQLGRPVLERQRHLKETGLKELADRVSLVRLLKPDLLWVTIQSSLLMSAFMFSYYSISFWYPTFLREQGVDTLRYLIAFNGAAILGIALWGRASEGVLGRRGAVTLAALTGVVSVPLFLTTSSSSLLLVGALMMGATGGGIWGMAPAYLMERFPTAVRGVGPGLSYHVGAAVGSATPLVLGQLQDSGMTIGGAMTLSIAISGLLVAAMIWLGPETRGRHFSAVDDATASAAQSVGTSRRSSSMALSS